MALVICPDCGHEISEYANMCPNCGFPLQKFLKENNFTNISYMTYDIEYHGWAGDSAKNMHNINDELTTLALQMYLVCCQALNESPYEEENTNV